MGWCVCLRRCACPLHKMMVVQKRTEPTKEMSWLKNLVKSWNYLHYNYIRTSMWLVCAVRLGARELWSVCVWVWMGLCSLHIIALNENETFCLARSKSAIIYLFFSLLHLSMINVILLSSLFCVSISLFPCFARIPTPLIITIYGVRFLVVFVCRCEYSITSDSVWLNAALQRHLSHSKCLPSFYLSSSPHSFRHWVHVLRAIRYAGAVGPCLLLILLFKFLHLHVRLIDSNQINDLIDLPCTKCRRRSHIWCEPA